jgi:hypothetical protein
MQYINITAALLAPIVAIFLAWLAYEDYRTKNEQFKLDLYDRRYIVYKAIENLLRDIMRDGKVVSRSMNQFIADTNERDFLFDEEIPIYINGLRKKAIRLQYLERMLDDSSLPVGDRRTKLAEEQCDLLTWFDSQFEVSKNIFKKYLVFKK